MTRNESRIGDWTWNGARGVTGLSAGDWPECRCPADGRIRSTIQAESREGGPGRRREDGLADDQTKERSQLDGRDRGIHRRNYASG
ncbi:MAG: hypothetical protein AB1847_02505 [bacterium]